MIRPKDFRILRSIFAARWASVYTPETWVALSGGADSASVLFTALACGVKPRCFTFHLAGYESADLLVAKSMAKEFGLEHRVVVIPNDPAIVRADARRAIAACDNRYLERCRKLLVQVLHPWFYIRDQLGEGTRVIVGNEADTMFLTARHDRELVREKGDDFVRKYRRPVLYDPSFSGHHIHHLCDALGIVNDDLYFSSEVAAWFQRFGDAELHAPVLKWGTVGAYQEYWQRGNWRRDPSSYQVNSGIRDMHAKAFGCEDKSTIGHYNEIARELGIVYGELLETMRYTDEEPARFLLPNGTPAGEPTERDRQVALGLETPSGKVADPGLA